MTAIVDYGVGNLFSLCCSLESIGCKAVVSSDENVLTNAHRIILPGVGAFGDAAERLNKSGMDKVLTRLAEKGKPLLGICLGMQLLFEESEEFGLHKGLGLIPGKVCSLRSALNEKNSSLKVPHIGWNNLNIIKTGSPLMKYISSGVHMYYVHSFYADTKQEYISGQSEYGIWINGSVEHKNVFGTQFHPEKSGDAGLKLLKAFCEIYNNNQ